MDGKIDVNITFDDNNQIRVLSSDKFRETENLKGECIDFLKSKYQGHFISGTSAIGKLITIFDDWGRSASLKLLQEN